MTSDFRRVVESVLSDHMTSQVWTGNYSPVFPFTPQSFSVGALLPMILYLFRWGHRRGRGKFEAAFGANGKPTIRSVADRLAQEATMSGFDSEVGGLVLSDILLTSALENRRHSESHAEQVQRCFPTHYLSSWIDLPSSAGHLRGVPEMIVALLNGQPSGATVEPFQERGRYRVGSRVQDNELLQFFAPGVSTHGEFKNSSKSDRFDETAQVGLDQLIMIRLAQICGEAPSKAAGRGEKGPIPNQRPIAKRAADIFREDLLTFLECYGPGTHTPRGSLISMVESGLAIGLTTVLLSTIGIMTRWSETGYIENNTPNAVFPIFMDCSSWTDTELRDLSENSSGLLRQAMGRLPAILMYARLLDYYVRYKSDIPQAALPSSAPDATAWLELLGEFLTRTNEEARDAEKFFRGLSRELIEAAGAEPDFQIFSELLGAEMDRGMHGRSLAEALNAAFIQTGGGRDLLNKFLTSALMIDENNGLARRRQAVANRARSRGGQRTGDVVSFVLSNTALEYLVHRHIRRTGKGRKARSLSYPQFLEILRLQYGFYIDRAPPNMQAPSELLQRNRRMLERRLRDLGLLTGVNDAEQMKKLKARYRNAYDSGEDAEAT